MAEDGECGFYVALALFAGIIIASPDYDNVKPRHADLNGDSHIDLIVRNQEGNYEVFLGSEEGTLSRVEKPFEGQLGERVKEEIEKMKAK